MFTTKKLAIVLLAITLMVAGFSFNVAPASAAGCVPHYVTFGQTLWDIGRMYGVPWQVIGQSNGIVNPNYIRAGTVICVPTGAYGGAYGVGGPVYSSTWSQSYNYNQGYNPNWNQNSNTNYNINTNINNNWNTNTNWNTNSNYGYGNGYGCYSWPCY